MSTGEHVRVHDVLPRVDSPRAPVSAGWSLLEVGRSGVSCSCFCSSRRRHTRLQGDWSSDVCSSDLYWVEKRGRGCFLQATPIDVSSIVSQRLFRQVDTVVLTSATLAVSGGFDFTEKRLGLENARTLVVPGHF